MHIYGQGLLFGFWIMKIGPLISDTFWTKFGVFRVPSCDPRVKRPSHCISMAEGFHFAVESWKWFTDFGWLISTSVLEMFTNYNDKLLPDPISTTWLAAWSNFNHLAKFCAILKVRQTAFFNGAHGITWYIMNTVNLYKRLRDTWGL